MQCTLIEANALPLSQTANQDQNRQGLSRSLNTSMQFQFSDTQLISIIISIMIIIIIRRGRNSVAVLLQVYFSFCELRLSKYKRFDDVVAKIKGWNFIINFHHCNQSHVPVFPVFASEDHLFCALQMHSFFLLLLFPWFGNQNPKTI